MSATKAKLYKYKSKTHLYKETKRNSSNTWWTWCGRRIDKWTRIARTPEEAEGALTCQLCYMLRRAAQKQAEVPR